MHLQDYWAAPQDPKHHSECIILLNNMEAFERFTHNLYYRTTTLYNKEMIVLIMIIIMMIIGLLQKYVISCFREEVIVAISSIGLINNFNRLTNEISWNRKSTRRLLFFRKLQNCDLGKFQKWLQDRHLSFVNTDRRAYDIRQAHQKSFVKRGTLQQVY